MVGVIPTMSRDKKPALTGHWSSAVRCAEEYQLEAPIFKDFGSSYRRRRRGRQ